MKVKSDFYFDLINDIQKSFNLLDELSQEIVKITRLELNSFYDEIFKEKTKKLSLQLIRKNDNETDIPILNSTFSYSGITCNKITSGDAGKTDLEAYGDLVLA